MAAPSRPSRTGSSRRWPRSRAPSPTRSARRWPRRRPAPRLRERRRRHRAAPDARARRFAVGLVPVPDRPALLGKATVRADDPVRGVATSGRHGRSFSLGIADAVTVLATSPRRRRRGHDDRERGRPARASRDPPGARRRARARHRPRCRAVTAAVGPLRVDEVARRSHAGVEEAERLRAAGLIAGAVLCLRRTARDGREPRASVRRRGVIATDIRKIVTIVEDVRMRGRAAGRPADPSRRHRRRAREPVRRPLRRGPRPS